MRCPPFCTFQLPYPLLSKCFRGAHRAPGTAPRNNGYSHPSCPFCQGFFSGQAVFPPAKGHIDCKPPSAKYLQCPPPPAPWNKGLKRGGRLPPLSGRLTASWLLDQELLPAHPPELSRPLGADPPPAPATANASRQWMRKTRFRMLTKGIAISRYATSHGGRYSTSIPPTTPKSFTGRIASSMN